MIRFCLIFLCIFTSCKTHEIKNITNNSHNINYQSEYNYKNVYIADTISIENPVIFHTTDDYLIITTKSNFITNKDFSKKLLKKEGYFLFNDGVLISFSLPEKLSEKLNLYNGDLIWKKFTPISKANDKIHAVECNDTLSFILLLVSKNYYNRAFTALDGPPSICDNNDNEYLYYKVLIPYFESNKKSGLMTPSASDPWRKGGEIEESFIMEIIENPLKGKTPKEGCISVGKGVVIHNNSIINTESYKGNIIQSIKK